MSFTCWLHEVLATRDGACVNARLCRNQKCIGKTSNVLPATSVTKAVGGSICIPSKAMGGKEGERKQRGALECLVRF